MQIDGATDNAGQEIAGLENDGHTDDGYVDAHARGNRQRCDTVTQSIHL